MPLRRTLSLVACLGVLSVPSAFADEVDDLIAAIQQVGPRGAGHADAVPALRQLERVSPDELVRILRALDDATPLSANWLRGAFESVAARALQARGRLPEAELESFLGDRSHSPQARRLAYEWLAKANPGATDRIIPNMLQDPSAEMRRDAVARLIDQAQQAESAGRADDARTLYQQALTGATDGDQVQSLAEALAKLQQPVDLVQHFALVTKWHVIGPFDNRDGVGFAAVYPPEDGVDLSAEYEGMTGPVTWVPLAAEQQPGGTDLDEVGKFDLAKLTEPHKGAVSYATTEFVSDSARPVEFRIATPNAWKLWVNGEMVFGQEEYHRGMMFDQYAARGTLRKGTNRILLKICQNEMSEDWAQTWAFQFRVCDLAGKGLLPAGARTAAAAE
jgi:hypothetical protein